MTRWIQALVVTIVMLAAPRAALACPVCFGRSDSPLAIATNLGVMAMLVVVFAVLGSFAAFFVYLARRARMMADARETS
jgi:hypothetical protein